MTSRNRDTPLFPVLAGTAGWRFGLIALTAAYYLAFAIWPRLFDLYGFGHQFGWFLDSYAILASNDAVASGLNPWIRNPLDLIGRPHVYSHWWLQLSNFGFTRDDNFLLGGMFVTVFFVASLWWMRPRSRLELVWFFAVLASPAVMFAVERGNNDLLVCALLIPVAAALNHQKAWVRWLSLAPLLIATALKFYPAVGMIIVLAAPTRREAWARGITASILLGVVLLGLREDLSRISSVVPQPKGLMTTGACRLFMRIGLDRELYVVCGILMGFLAWVLCRPWRLFEGWSVESTDRSAWLGLILGSILLAGCFFAGSSYSYRLVLGIMLAPMLWRLTDDKKLKRPVRRLAIMTAALLLAMMWVDAILSYIATEIIIYRSVESVTRWYNLLSSFSVPLEWCLVTCLLCFISKFIMDIFELSGLNFRDKKADLQ